MIKNNSRKYSGIFQDRLSIIERCGAIALAASTFMGLLYYYERKLKKENVEFSKDIETPESLILGKLIENRQRADAELKSKYRKDSESLTLEMLIENRKRANAELSRKYKE